MHSVFGTLRTPKADTNGNSQKRAEEGFPFQSLRPGFEIEPIARALITIRFDNRHRRHEWNFVMCTLSALPKRSASSDTACRSLLRQGRLDPSDKTGCSRAQNNLECQQFFAKIAPFRDSSDALNCIEARLFTCFIPLRPIHVCIRPWYLLSFEISCGGPLDGFSGGRVNLQSPPAFSFLR